MFPHGVDEFLGSFTIPEFIDRVSDFRRLNFRQMSSAEISQAVQKVLLGSSGRSLVPTSIRIYASGTTFFRVRKPLNSGTSVPMDCLLSEHDAWEPPAHVVCPNRLNRANEPLLYTTPMNLTVAMEEARLNDGSPAAIFVYKAACDVKVNVIGDRFDEIQLNAEQRLRARLWADFLHDEFTRDAGPENEHIYRVSEAIAKDWFDLPPRDVQHAWCYPSVVSRPNWNVCFRPDLARECLRLVGALVGLRQTDTFSVKLVATLADGQFHYHQLGSDVQKSIFPEILVLADTHS